MQPLQQIVYCRIIQFPQHHVAIGFFLLPFPTLPEGQIKGNILLNYQTNNGQLGESFNLGGNQRIEFGQGIVQTTACSGNTQLGLLPQAKFTNSSGTGAWYFKSISVSNIPLGCQGSDFLISAYGQTNATPNATASPGN